MKTLKLQIKMYLAELLLNLAFRIAPSDKEGRNLKASIINYFNSCLLYKKSDEILKHMTKESNTISRHYRMKTK